MLLEIRHHRHPDLAKDPRVIIGAVEAIAIALLFADVQAGRQMTFGHGAGLREEVVRHRQGIDDDVLDWLIAALGQNPIQERNVEDRVMGDKDSIPDKVVNEFRRFRRVRRAS